ncbi:MAG: organic solvent ABC transporter permease [Planctomycetes bacterium SCN 63-9]|nr:MAG: organic solvent ABC transporter permease [Planctomycetes bacterium SCN 63-9]
MIEHGLACLENIGRFIDFALRVFVSIPVALASRPGDVLVQFERVAVQSLPIVLGAGISVGLVTWFQTHRILAAHGAESTLPSFLGVVVLVEIGPMLAGLLVASRMGAGLAAELSAMHLNEEIDARIILGVAPRTIACAMAVPLLTVLIDASALGGGLAAELAAGHLSPTAYGHRAMDFLRFSDIIPATLKTSVFGFLIGVVGCWTGLRAGRSAEEVGHAATSGVVRSTLAVFAANVVVVPLIQAISDSVGWFN